MPDPGLRAALLLAGHGSETRNNPHAAGLDCGACCGQTGEVNARAGVALLNARDVRGELTARGIHVPDETRFVAGMHNTTTDDVVLFDVDEVPASHATDLARPRTLEPLRITRDRASTARGPSLSRRYVKKRWSGSRAPASKTRSDRTDVAFTATGSLRGFEYRRGSKGDACDHGLVAARVTADACKAVGLATTDGERCEEHDALPGTARARL